MAHELECQPPNAAARRGHYTAEDVERALLYLALNMGSYQRAAQEFNRQTGRRLSRQVLHGWAGGKHAERYQRIREELVPQIHARLAQDAEDAARHAVTVQRAALAVAERQLAAGDVRDAAGAARNAATVAGIMVDKAALLRSRPTAIVEHRDAAEIARALAALRPDVFTIEEDEMEALDSGIRSLAD